MITVRVGFGVSSSSSIDLVTVMKVVLVGDSRFVVVADGCSVVIGCWRIVVRRGLESESTEMLESGNREAPPAQERLLCSRPG